MTTERVLGVVGLFDKDGNLKTRISRMAGRMPALFFDVADAGHESEPGDFVRPVKIVLEAQHDD